MARSLLEEYKALAEEYDRAIYASGWWLGRQRDLSDRMGRLFDQLPEQGRKEALAFAQAIYDKKMQSPPQSCKAMTYE